MKMVNEKCYDLNDPPKMVHRSTKDCMQNIYDFVLQATEKVAPTGIYHLSHILFHNDILNDPPKMVHRST